MKDIESTHIKKYGKPCIYKIHNMINNKVYIGSANGHYRRKGQHYWMLRNNKHFNKHLQSSWNKHKECNFNFEIIEFITNTDTILTREEYFIKKYDATNPTKGYNHRNNCHTTLGNKWPIESRLKFSKLKKGKKIPHLDYNKVAKLNMKQVIGINKKTKKQFIFESVKAASKYFNIHTTNISKALHYTTKSAGGYYWNFVEKSASNNSVNSGKLLKDNPEPS